MRLYRVSYTVDEHEGYTWHRSAREAQRAAGTFFRDRTSEGMEPDTSIECIEFNNNKAGLVKLLNRYADRADNG